MNQQAVQSIAAVLSRNASTLWTISRRRKTDSHLRLPLSFNITLTCLIHVQKRETVDRRTSLLLLLREALLAN
jgi:hypothetical protein